ncbi:serine/threonine-protein kinase tnni3k-related [Anaeramoeba flamelloides]|uniref:Serine/threonine-protein kinase tnni3k-related n=1 Tax=Anaeramoeba flamelloides TaxID=1746091 RepID=A0AAV8A322_9EUKA|nr:serine/threonine-protein kinase tnni3k-related [Anaeramoeba flamelloides]
MSNEMEIEDEGEEEEETNQCVICNKSKIDYYCRLCNVFYCINCEKHIHTPFLKTKHQSAIFKIESWKKMKNENFKTKEKELLETKNTEGIFKKTPLGKNFSAGNANKNVKILSTNEKKKKKKTYREKQMIYPQTDVYQKQKHSFQALIKDKEIRQQCLELGKISSYTEYFNHFRELFPNDFVIRISENKPEVRFDKKWKDTLSHCKCMTSKNFLNSLRNCLRGYGLFRQPNKQYYLYTNNSDTRITREKKKRKEKKVMCKKKEKKPQTQGLNHKPKVVVGKEKGKSEFPGNEATQVLFVKKRRSTNLSDQGQRKEDIQKKKSQVRRKIYEEKAQKNKILKNQLNQKEVPKSMEQSIDEEPMPQTTRKKSRKQSAKEKLKFQRARTRRQQYENIQKEKENEKEKENKIKIVDQEIIISTETMQEPESPRTESKSSEGPQTQEILSQVKKKTNKESNGKKPKKKTNKKKRPKFPIRKKYKKSAPIIGLQLHDKEKDNNLSSKNNNKKTGYSPIVIEKMQEPESPSTKSKNSECQETQEIPRQVKQKTNKESNGKKPKKKTNKKKRPKFPNSKKYKKSAPIIGSQLSDKQKDNNPSAKKNKKKKEISEEERFQSLTSSMSQLSVNKTQSRDSKKKNVKYTENLQSVAKTTINDDMSNYEGFDESNVFSGENDFINESKGKNILSSLTETKTEPKTKPKPKQKKKNKKSMNKVSSKENRLSKYSINEIDLQKLNKLGPDKNSNVFQCKWQNSIVATKELDGKKIFYKKKFLEEVEILFDLNHPNLVRLYAICLNPPLIAMELCNGGSLYDFLRNRGSSKRDLLTNWKERIKIALDISYGLKALHDQNILHLDLKSKNILLNFSLKFHSIPMYNLQVEEEKKKEEEKEEEEEKEDNQENEDEGYDYEVEIEEDDGGGGGGQEEEEEEEYKKKEEKFEIQAKISDVGECKYLGEYKNDNINQLIKNIPWMAPEIFVQNNDKKYNKSCDIYSLGIIFYELSTLGKIPFGNSKNQMQLISKIMDGKRDHIPQKTPKKLKELIEKCWDQDPQKRPAINEIIKSLTKFIRSLEKTESSNNKNFTKNEDFRILNKENLNPFDQEKKNENIIIINKNTINQNKNQQNFNVNRDPNKFQKNNNNQKIIQKIFENQSKEEPLETKQHNSTKISSSSNTVELTGQNKGNRSGDEKSKKIQSTQTWRSIKYREKNERNQNYYRSNEKRNTANDKDHVVDMVGALCYLIDGKQKKVAYEPQIIRKRTNIKIMRKNRGKGEKKRRLVDDKERLFGMLRSRQEPKRGSEFENKYETYIYKKKKTLHVKKGVNNYEKEKILLKNNTDQTNDLLYEEESTESKESSSTSVKSISGKFIHNTSFVSNNLIQK